MPAGLAASDFYYLLPEIVLTATIVVVLIAVGAGLYSLVQWRKEGDFRPLFTGLSPEDAAGIVQKLMVPEGETVPVGTTIALIATDAVLTTREFGWLIKHFGIDFLQSPVHLA